MGLFDGTVTIVTGGARENGQGAAEARMIVEEGGRVVIGDILDEEGQETARALGSSARYLHLDVGSEQDWIDIVAFALAEFGRLDGLINNAGYSTTTPVVHLTMTEFDKLVDVNQKGVILGLKHAARAMIDSGRGGAIVNIASEAADRPQLGKVGYGGVKAAVCAMTKQAALELAPNNIRVNCILPGIINTYMVANAKPELVARKISVTPMARLGEPEEVANAALFLLSSKASFITGVNLPVDGGTLLM